MVAESTNLEAQQPSFVKAENLWIWLTNDVFEANLENNDQQLIFHWRQM